MHEVLVTHLGGLSLPKKSVVRLTYRPDMTLDVYRGVKQQHNNHGILTDSSTAIFWTKALVVLGVSGLFCRFYSIFGGKSC